ncbi:hypothetical protein DL764_000532 [Monosporascus ibericus]|uniref:Uncharacterized protein n=1 Tax=Monosporascus ibericus TaxID=155417 RepID=A0A4Q4TUY8_9PEZI|nr:hypothetical protein DL764_000532 [Monosporascus ibericus]
MSRPKYKPQYNADDASTSSNTENVSYPQGYQYEDAEENDASPSTAMSVPSGTTIHHVGLSDIAIVDVVETCVSQGSWIWCSGHCHGEEEAKIEDFKLFADAS